MQLQERVGARGMRWLKAQTCEDTLARADRLRVRLLRKAWLHGARADATVRKAGHWGDGHTATRAILDERQTVAVIVQHDLAFELGAARHDGEHALGAPIRWFELQLRSIDSRDGRHR